MDDDFENWLAGREEEIPADDGELFPGTVVGGYRIIARLGRGGFADVYRAEGENGDAVAIKILYKLDDKSRARFVRESEILSQIKHRNVPRLLSFGSCGNRPYMVTELLKGCELPSSDYRVAEFLRQIMSAVEELHRHGFIHRDIKPTNILARDDGTPVLIDFGLASPISALQREKEALSIEDGKKVAVGTPGYSAPEQFSGLPAGKEADVHAIGALIDACYKGRMPGCWKDIHLKATISNPKLRYRSVQELRRAVNMRHWRKVLAIGVSSVLVVAITLYAFLAVPSKDGMIGNLKEVSQSLSVNVADTNKQYSIRCQVVYKDKSIAHQMPDDDSRLFRPTDKELMSWLKDFIIEEYSDKDYESLINDFINEDFDKYVTEDFRHYVDNKISEMDQQVQLGIDIAAVLVDPEGEFKEDLIREMKKALQESE